MPLRVTMVSHFSHCKKLALNHLLVVDSDGQLYSDKIFTERLQLNDTNMSINILGTL